MKGRHQDEKSKSLRTIAQLCIFVGLGVVGLAQLIIVVDSSMYLLGIGSVIFASGLILITITTERGDRGLTHSEAWLVIGVVLMAVGVFSGLELLVFGGIALMAVPWIPQAAQFLRSIGRSLSRAYRELTAKG